MELCAGIDSAAFSTLGEWFLGLHHTLTEFIFLGPQSVPKRGQPAHEASSQLTVLKEWKDMWRWLFPSVFLFLPKVVPQFWGRFFSPTACYPRWYARFGACFLRVLIGWIEQMRASVLTRYSPWTGLLGFVAGRTRKS